MGELKYFEIKVSIQILINYLKTQILFSLLAYIKL
jgi:hypothetical protein